MIERLSGEELVALVRRVFQPKAYEKNIAILVDLPDAVVADNPDWTARRAELAQDAPPPVRKAPVLASSWMQR